jgi:hypothetical protein
MKWLFLILLLLKTSGCAHLGSAAVRQPTVTNPLVVYSRNEEQVWERVVDALHENLFTINRENRISHFIESDYKVGSGVLEPWHPDSQGVNNVWESSLQSIRRKIIARVIPAENQQGFVVSFEAYKELEDINGLVANSPGGATFSENRPLARNLNEVVGQTRQSQWIPKGRDVDLEIHLANAVSKKF